MKTATINAEQNVTLKPSYIISHNSFWAYFFICLIGASGVFFLNLLPVFISSLVDPVGLTEQLAGYIASANIYGSALGAFLIIQLIKKVYWKKLLVGAYIPFIIIDVISSILTDPVLLITVRFVSGVLAGLVVGTSFALIARLRNPDRGFAVLIIFQGSSGGLGLMLLAYLIPVWGIKALFLTLATTSMLAVLAIPFLSSYEVEGIKNPLNEEKKTFLSLPSSLTLLGIFLLQTALMAVFGYLQLIGVYHGLKSEWAGLSIGLGVWASLIGSAIVVLIGVRYGRFLLMFISYIVITTSLFLFHFSNNAYVFVTACCLLFIAYSVLLPYLFGMCSEFDKTGQMAATGGAASKLGLATGPFVSAMIFSGSNYDTIINVGIALTAISILLAVYPIMMLDRKSKR